MGRAWLCAGARPSPQNPKGSGMLRSIVLGTVTLLEGGPKAGLGLLVSLLAGGILEGGGFVPCPAPAPRCPCPPWRTRHGAGVTSEGPRRDKQGHRVEAGKVARTRSLNLN